VELLVEEEVSELSDSPSLVGTRRFSKDTSFRYLKSRARLKERSWSSNSSSSRRRSGRRGMNTNTTDDEHEVLVESIKDGSETQKCWRCRHMPTGRRHEGNPLSCPLSTFSHEGGFKVDHYLTIICFIILSIILDLALKKYLMVILMYSIMGRNNGTLKAPNMKRKMAPEKVGAIDGP